MSASPNDRNGSQKPNGPISAQPRIRDEQETEPEGQDQTPAQKQKRAANACSSCRTRKVRCSGDQPCQVCSRRGTECVFDVDDRRVVVSERYLRELQKAGASSNGELQEASVRPSKRPRVVHQSTDEVPRGSDRVSEDKRAKSIYDNELFTSPSVPECPQHTNSIANRSPLGETQSVPQKPGPRHETDFVKNPLAAKTAYVKDAKGRPRLLGPTSTWSFSRRTLALIKDHLSHVVLPDTPLYEDGSSYDLSWTHVASEALPDTSRLPSLEYSIYLLNTVKFHLGHMYRLFDETVFLQNLHEFYDDAATKARTDRLWYIQYLLVLAFGKAFLSQSSSRHAPSGFEFFTRAMSLMPQSDTLHREPILAMEVLCLVSLYLQSADMRESAYGYIGQALRIGLVEGFHRELPNDYMTPSQSERCGNIWWTVYILDRKFSSLMGAPNCVSDDDITASLPSATDTSRRAAALTLHIKISRLIARVLSTVYAVGGNLNGTFLTNMQDVLREMATLARELEIVFEGKFTNSVGFASGAASHLNLTYHQCIIVATRPLLLCLLEQRLSDINETTSSHRLLSAPVEGVLKTCVDSATKMLMVLKAQQEDNLLESFIPFDLDHTVSAAFVLNLACVLQPSLSVDHIVRRSAQVILDDMISKGSMPARLRKAELELLEQSIAHLDLSRAQTRVQSPSNMQPTFPRQSHDFSNLGSSVTLENNASHPDLVSETPVNFDLMALNMGISPSQILFMADQLAAANFDIDFDTCTQNEWLWSDFGTN